MQTRTVQSGIETVAVPYLWLKGTLFHSDLDGIEYTNDGSLHNQIKQGFELEARTVPLFGLSLTSGYTYIDAWDKDTKKQLQTDSGQSVPPQLVKVGLNYDDKVHGVRGTILGNYVWWNAVDRNRPSYHTTIWDLHLNWQLFPKDDFSPEIFFSCRNLFNGLQTYDTTLYNNTPRWFEGGLRFKF
jgi:vitamin B12 transporter